ncbi:hypothetical protein ACLB2K_004308 [Fragaria x ananassa]
MDSPVDFVAKIGDFGLTKSAQNLYSRQGTKWYLPPETVLCNIQGKASDIWAVGCLVLEMLTGSLWTYKSTEYIGVWTSNPVIPSHLSDDAKDFLSKCLDVDASKRFTARRLLVHSFLMSVEQLPKLPTLSKSQRCHNRLPSFIPLGDSSSHEAQMSIESSGLDDDTIFPLALMSRPDKGFENAKSVDFNCNRSYKTLLMVTEHEFTAKENDWGFTKFTPFRETRDLFHGYLVNNICIVEANVSVRKGDVKILDQESGELMHFESLGRSELAFHSLLDEVCLLQPSFIERRRAMLDAAEVDLEGLKIDLVKAEQGFYKIGDVDLDSSTSRFRLLVACCSPSLSPCLPESLFTSLIPCEIFVLDPPLQARDMLLRLSAAPPATTTPNTSLFLLFSTNLSITHSSSSFSPCSLRNSSGLHTSCRPLKAMAAQEAQFSTSASGDRQALISLSDKNNLAFLGNGLQSLGYKIVSTGGTASALESAGVSVTKVEELTCFPEMLDGRVKTLHPNIHGGILARRDQKHHMEALSNHGIGIFDVVVVNLYPFYDKVTSTGGIEFEDGIENIDIGGPAMIRAAAKNHKDVLVVVDSEDYPTLLEYLKADKDDQQFRRKLAWKAFQHVASYDSAVSEWLWRQTSEDKFPPSLTVPLSLKSPLRYGENPHQKAAFYVDKSLSEVNAGGIATAIQHHGKEMSYNNYLDADAAWNCVSEFRGPTCVVVKHTNPCGVASRDDILEAYRLAVKADPVSAFGGIVAFNIEVDEALAKEIREFRSPTDGETRMFYEIVVAPKYSKKGLEILRGKSKTLRILEASKNEKGKLSLRQVGGGWLAQDSDDLTPQDIQFNVVSKKSPQESELSDAEFAWLCVKHVKSNAIVLAKNNCMLGMGSGQPNRRESLRIALKKAGEDVKGAALASDAFFPFAWKDAVEEACESGVSVIAEPGGSIRDGDAIDCCNKYGVSLVFTNVRHFRH